MYASLRVAHSRWQLRNMFFCNTRLFEARFGHRRSRAINEHAILLKALDEMLLSEPCS